MNNLKFAIKRYVPFLKNKNVKTKTGGGRAGATDEFKGQIFFFFRVSAFLLDIAEQPAPPPWWKKKQSSKRNGNLSIARKI